MANLAMVARAQAAAPSVGQAVCRGCLRLWAVGPGPYKRTTRRFWEKRTVMEVRGEGGPMELALKH